MYDTESVCRAVVTARGIAPHTDLLGVSRALQHAFYVDGHNKTDGKVLSEVAAIILEAGGHLATAEGLYIE